jgi:Skp family chaperone for outer membrane proteins
MGRHGHKEAEPRARRAVFALMLCLCGVMGLGLSSAPSRAVAQELGLPNSTILVIDLNRLYRETLFGQRVSAELDEESKALAAENRRIEAELSAEEKALTKDRPTMKPDDFRAKADAFDAKVRRIRKEQDQKVAKLSNESDSAEQRFLTVARPVLEQLMRDAGATVLLDTRAVLLSADDADITAEAVVRIDRAIGDGAKLELPKGAPSDDQGTVAPPPEQPESPAAPPQQQE